MFFSQVREDRWMVRNKALSLMVRNKALSIVKHFRSMKTGRAESCWAMATRVWISAHGVELWGGRKRGEGESKTCLFLKMT